MPSDKEIKISFSLITKVPTGDIDGLEDAEKAWGWSNVGVVVLRNRP